jgi:class 3 adenylate cyclase
MQHLSSVLRIRALLPQEDGTAVVGTVSHVCSRGLRLKVGIDVGRVMDSVHAATGRMAYRGKVMNRAARIAFAASSGQVRTEG